MIQILIKALRDFPAWERPARWSLGLALVALAGCVLVIVSGPNEARLGAVIGAFGALVVLQAAILYSYRHMVNDLALAQRAYLDGDYETAMRLLEGVRASGRARWRELALLGMVYRQQGRLDDSLGAIRAALVLAPDYHYPQYALGRTLLEQGEYHDAADAFAKAVAEGAPPEVHLDWAEALWRAGDTERARSALAALDDGPLVLDAQRALLAALLRWRLGLSEPPAAELVMAGQPGWQVVEARCAGSVYGAAVARDRAAFTPSPE
ncbi:MAG TPA: tetratricopeptide repeat protein [Candidatus Limnocylindrales bacterium]|nr:tetratricopeptide repeat protein [Candidatus Limnocylindrales bacterium]